MGSKVILSHHCPLHPLQGLSYLALRIFTSAVQFLLHLLLPWRCGVSFLLHPFGNLRQGQKNGTSGDLFLLGACITGCMRKRKKSQILFSFNHPSCPSRSELNASSFLPSFLTLSATLIYKLALGPRAYSSLRGPEMLKSR